MTDLRTEKQRAFEQQALAHRTLLYRFALRLRGNAADADDLVQETYLKAFRFWDSFDQGTNVRAWLCRILKNSAFSLYRKESAEPTMVEHDETMGPIYTHGNPADTDNLEELAFNRPLDDEVFSAMGGLKEDFRTIVILRYLEGLTYDEIACFLDCPLGTVRSRLHRARRHLHAELFQYAQERGTVEQHRSPKRSFTAGQPHSGRHRSISRLSREDADGGYSCDQPDLFRR